MTRRHEGAAVWRFAFAAMAAAAPCLQFTRTGQVHLLVTPPPGRIVTTVSYRRLCEPTTAACTIVASPEEATMSEWTRPSLAYASPAAAVACPNVTARSAGVIAIT